MSKILAIPTSTEIQNSKHYKIFANTITRLSRRPPIRYIHISRMPTISKTQILLFTGSKAAYLGLGNGARERTQAIVQVILGRKNKQCKGQQICSYQDKGADVPNGYLIGVYPLGKGSFKERQGNEATFLSCPARYRVVLELFSIDSQQELETP